MTSQFQRMIAMPEEEYLQLSVVQNARQPLTQQFYNLESQYNRDAYIRDPYRRMVLQSDTLDNMKELKEKMRNYIVVSTPKPYRSRAQALFESMSSFLQFTERGEMYDKDKNLIPNSRIEDLIQHAVRDRRRNISPTGWNDFLQLLREHNIPRSILNRDTIDEMEQRQVVVAAAAAHKVEDPTRVKKRKRSSSKGAAPQHKRSKRVKTPSQKFLESLQTY